MNSPQCAPFPTRDYESAVRQAEDNLKEIEGKIQTAIKSSNDADADDLLQRAFFARQDVENAKNELKEQVNGT